MAAETTSAAVTFPKGGSAMANVTRKNNIHFMATDEERDLIEKQMAQAGIKSLRAYLLKMALEGQIVRIELDSVKEMVRLLSNATNNINQIARRANTTGSIYAADLDELRLRYDEIWGQVKLILRKMSEI